jgi:hypothetical protein
LQQLRKLVKKNDEYLLSKDRLVTVMVNEGEANGFKDLMFSGNKIKDFQENYMSTGMTNHV